MAPERHTGPDYIDVDAVAAAELHDADIIFIGFQSFLWKSSDL